MPSDARSDVSSAVATLVRELPKPVQDFVLGEERDQIILSLSKKHNLHVDQAGDFERAILHMLLGVASPDDFVQELRNTGIPQTNIDAITVDVNEQIFKPLRRRERELGAVSATPPKAEPPFKRNPTQASESDRGMRTMEADMTKATSVAQETPVYQPPYNPASQTQTYWVPVSITATPQPYMSTEPPPMYAQPVQAPPPTPPPPVETPRAKEPVPPPPPVQPVLERDWEPPPPPNLPTAEPASTPIRKEYGADPYREPI